MSVILNVSRKCCFKPKNRNGFNYRLYRLHRYNRLTPPLKFCHEEIRTVIANNLLKICEIGESAVPIVESRSGAVVRRSHNVFPTLSVADV